MESHHINDLHRYHESDEKGSIILLLGSENMLEEDLAGLEKTPTILTKEKHQQLTKETLRDTITTIGAFIPSEKLNALFPGLLISDNIDDYDFALSTLRISILSSEDYALFYKTYKPSVPGEGKAGMTWNTSYKRDRTQARIDLSEKRLILVNETPTEVQKIVDNSANAETDKDVIALNVKATLVHELLHSLGVGDSLDSPLEEAIIEWYTQKILQANDSNFQNTKEDQVWVANRKMPQVVSIIFDVMLEKGLPFDTINKAFLADDKESLGKIMDFLVQRYGQNNAYRLMDWDFKSDNEALAFVVDLEWDKDSKITSVLKRYRTA